MRLKTLACGACLVAAVVLSTATQLQAMQNQLSVAEAVGGAMKMSAQYGADYANAMQQGKTATEASALAAARMAQTEAQINAQAQETLWNLKNQYQVSAAVTGDEQIRAQRKATYNKLLHEGVEASLANAIAAAEEADARAKATAAVLRQVHSLEQSTEMIYAQANGTQAMVAAAQAWENAMRSGADATAAAAISAATLANETAKAAVAQAKADQAEIDKLNNLPRKSTFSPNVMPSGPLSFQTGWGRSDDWGWSNVAGMMMIQAQNEAPGISGLTGSAYQKNGDINAAINAIRNAPNSYGVSDTMENYARVTGSKVDPQAILGVERSTIDDKISNYDALVQLQNAKTSDKGQQIGNLKAEMDWLQTLPETISRDQKIVSLQQSIDQLKGATDANTAATQATLNPLYSQGHGALAIGYYHAASGLDLMAQGPTSGDQVPFHAMINGGERVIIQTKEQQRASSNDNSRTTTIVQNFDMRGVSTNNARRSQRQFAQGFGQVADAMR